MGAEKGSWHGLASEATLDPRAPLSPDSCRLLTIYEIGRQLLEKREPDEVLHTIHRAIVEHLEPDHACVLSVAGGDAYRPVFAHNLDLSGRPERWPLSRTVLRRARERGLAYLATDAAVDVATESVGSFHIRSVLCVPLGSGDVCGMIYADRRGRRRLFTRQDLEFLTAIAVYASLALERAEEHSRTAEALRVADERLALAMGELLRHEIVGSSPRLLAAYDSLRRFARAGVRVLLRGETGTGKELFARAYAASSDRAGRPYVPVPIPALAPTLIESELFGHVRGAFTEATRDNKGRLEMAEGGVLFLDEVGDIDLALQAKLLRFLDSGELHRVGDNQPRRVDAYVVSATNRPLEKMVAEGRFRSDLLARLGHVVWVPPLRERPEDIPLLVEHFLRMHDRGPRRKTFTAETIEILRRCRWDLNVRQLQQVVEHVVCLVDHDVVRPEDLPPFVSEGGPIAPEAAGTGPRAGGGRALKDVVDEVERRHILETLRSTGGNRRKAIEILQISSETFYKRLEEFGLHRKGG